MKLIKLLFWLVGLAVIVIAAAVFLITTIDPNEHKDWIADKFHEKTGRSISLGGPVALTLYPWLGLEASEVSIADTGEFGAGPFVNLDYIKLRIKSLPLLRAEYEVDTIIVRGADINLVRNEQGIANWDDHDGLDEGTDNRDEVKRDKPLLPLAAVALGGVAIEDARLTLDDQQAAARYEVSDLDVSTAELKYGEPVDINMSFSGRSSSPELDATVALAGIITYATDAQRFSIDPLDVNAVIKGRNIPGGRTSAKLSTAVDVNLDAETVTLSDFTLSALEGLGLESSGHVEINNIFGEPGVRFDLSMDKLDLDRYLHDGSKKGQGPAQSGKKGGRIASLPIVAAGTTDMEGDLSIDRLIISNARLDGFRLHFKAQDGVLQADPVTASLYEGRLTAGVDLDVNSAIPTLTLNSDLTGIQAEPLLKDMTGKARLRGKGNFTAALSAAGTSFDAMKRSLDGRMTMEFTEGAIAGFNLGRTLRQWKQFDKGRNIDLEETAATDFTEFTGNPVAKDGIIRMDDLVLKAPAFRLQGTGVLADLHTNTIDYQARATVVNTAKGAGGKELTELEGLELPLKVSGSLDNPKIRLDWEDILSGLLLNKVLDVLDLPLPGTGEPGAAEKDEETDEDSGFDPVKKLLKEGLKEGLKGIFKKK